MVASTSSKRDDQLSEVLEKVLHRLDEMELNLGKLQSKSSLHRSPSPRQHSASSYTHEHQSRPKHRHFDDQQHQPFRSFSPQQSPSPHRRFHTLASDRQVLNDLTIVTRIPTDHRVRNVTSADQAHPDITRTTMADPPAHQDVTPKAHRILNGTQHKTSGNPTANLHSLTAAILMVGESHPIVQ